jgi:hypothetical protein
MDERNKPVSDWRLERLAQGELDQAAARDVESKLGKEETAARLAGLASSNKELLDRLPPEVVGASIRRRLQERRPRRAMWVMALVPVAMAAGVWAVGFSPKLASNPEDHAEIVLSKGSTRLLAYRAATPGNKPVRLGQAARVKPHDVLQLAYTAGKARFGTVLSVDGRGVVTQHLPVNAGNAAPLDATGETNLPQAYELDDAPGFERFFLITADKPFSLSRVMEAARALAHDDDARRKALALAPELSQESLLLEKVQP